MAQPAHLEPVASGFTPHIHGPYRADLNIEQHFSRLLDLRLGCQRVHFEHVCPQFIRQLIAFSVTNGRTIIWCASSFGPNDLTGVGAL